MKHTLLSFLFAIMPLMASADAVEIDGIWYNLISKAKQAEVTYNPSNSEFSGSYSGDITIPDIVTYEKVEYNVTSIGEYAFKYCFDLNSVTIPNCITSIGGAAFYYCSKITSVTIPSGVTSLNGSTFAYCSSLTSIIIPNSVSTIGNFVFAYCTGLTSMIIPNSVTSLGWSVFQGCSGLTSVTIPDNFTEIGNCLFQDCSSLTSITIPNKVENIGSDAFSGCSCLTSVTIPDGTTSIGYRTFYGCNNLTSITIGSGVYSLGQQSIANCSNMTDVFCLAKNVPDTNSDAFEGSYIEFTTLHVPASSLEKYRSTSPWSGFKEIVAMDDSEVPETSILEIDYEGNQNQQIFDISGRRLSKPSKGVNIIKGKKIIIK